MPLPHAFRHFTPFQFLGCVLSQQFVNLVAPTGVALQQRLVDQGHQLAQRGAGHLLGCLAGKATAKDGQSLEHLPLPLGEQAPRMVKDGAHAALPFGHVAQIGLQKVEALADLGRDLGGGQHLQPARRQQDAQGHATHQATDAGHVPEVGGRQLKARPDPARALQEELDRAVVKRVLGRLPVGEVHPGQVEEVLALHVQPGPRGGQDLDIRGGFQHVAHQAQAVPSTTDGMSALRAGEEVLEVVQ